MKMTNYSIKGENLCFQDAVIYQAPNVIIDILDDLSGNTVIIYDGFHMLPSNYNVFDTPPLDNKELQATINQNVICINQNGEILWRIEETANWPEDHVRFIGSKKKIGELWTYRRDAWEFQIDPSNGKVLQKRRGL